MRPRNFWPFACVAVIGGAWLWQPAAWALDACGCLLGTDCANDVRIEFDSLPWPPLNQPPIDTRCCDRLPGRGEASTRRFTQLPITYAGGTFDKLPATGADAVMGWRKVDCWPWCGDGRCGGNETCSSCPGDCGACPPVCGDTVCESARGECSSCSSDCTVAQCCGNDPTCNSAVGETCGNCSRDCGACAPVCGDARCTGSETCQSCPGDCGGIRECNFCGSGNNRCRPNNPTACNRGCANFPNGCGGAWHWNCP